MPDRLIISGSRSLYPTVAELSILISTAPDLVVCGCASGVDRAGFLWARVHNIPVEFFPAWKHHQDWAISVAAAHEVVHPLPRLQNKGAGHVRNEAMARFGTRVLILMEPQGSPGSRDMRDAALNAGIPCCVRNFIMEGSYCVAQ